jgi:hypothetical protein
MREFLVLVDQSDDYGCQFALLASLCYNPHAKSLTADAEPETRSWRGAGAKVRLMYHTACPRKGRRSHFA